MSLHKLWRLDTDAGPENLSAEPAAIRVFRGCRRGSAGLMALRNCLVAPLGLKTGVSGQAASGDRIGFFPVISEMPELVVLDLDDKHLDFRIAVDVTPAGSARAS